MLNIRSVGINLTLLVFCSCNQIKSYFALDKQEEKSSFEAAARTVRPQDNFYEAANEGWLKQALIPVEMSAFSAFDELAAYAEQSAFRQLGDVAEDYQANKELTPSERLCAQIFLDYTAPMKAGDKELGALKGIFTAIDAVKSSDELMALWGKLQWLGAPFPLALELAPDKKTQTYAPIFTVRQELTAFEQAIQRKKKPEAARSVLQETIGNVLKTLGYTDYKDVSGQIITLNEALVEAMADASAQAAASKDQGGKSSSSEKMLARMTVSETTAAIVGIPWAKILDAAGYSKSEFIFVDHPPYFRSLKRILSTTSLDTLKAHTKFNILAKYAEVLPQSYYRPLMSFKKSFFGSTASLDQRGRESGYLFVRESLPYELDSIAREVLASPEDIKEAETIVRGILASYQALVPTAQVWSDSGIETIKQYLTKVNTSIGEVDQAGQLDSITFEKGALIGNVLAVQESKYRKVASRMGAQVDAKDYLRPVRAVRVFAHYVKDSDRIQVTAAALNPPLFYKADAPHSLNYGSFGYMIARDITARFFEDPSLMPDDVKQALFTKYEPLKKLFAKHIDKNLVLSDDMLFYQIIPDLVALEVAHHAMKQRMDAKEQKSSTAVEQNFYMSFANVLRQKISIDFAKNLKTRAKPLLNNEQRVNLLVLSSARFQSAFGLTKADKLYNNAPLPPW